MDLTGRIGLVYDSPGFWPWAIRTVTKSRVSHAVIAIDNGRCMSAEPGGVRVRPVTHWPKVHWLPPMGTPKQMDAVAWNAECLEGAPYNRAAFVAAGADALGLIPTWAGQYIADAIDNMGVICSSLVDICHSAAGIDLLDGPSTFTWPGELERLG